MCCINSFTYSLLPFLHGELNELVQLLRSVLEVHKFQIPLIPIKYVLSSL